MINPTRSRVAWFLSFLHPSTRTQRVNFSHSMLRYLRSSSDAGGYPVTVKLDLSPACNLRCHACVHADSASDRIPRAALSAGNRMPVEEAFQIIDQIRGRSHVLQLYYYGDPFLYPDLLPVARYARDAGLRVVAATNFSYRFSDGMIEQIVSSGITHLRIGIDGFTQEVYGRTRRGGKLKYVRSNLERLLEMKQQLRARYPLVEVQYFRYQHNLGEFEQAKAWLHELGVDTVRSIWGTVHNCLDVDFGTYDVGERYPARRLPRCGLPWRSMVVKHDGNVVPCCEYRIGAQFRKDDPDAQCVGNVFSEGVEAVWNSSRYRQIRAGVAGGSINPHEGFCYGCPRLFDGDYHERMKDGRTDSVPEAGVVLQQD